MNLNSFKDWFKKRSQTPAPTEAPTDVHTQRTELSKAELAMVLVVVCGVCGVILGIGMKIGGL